MADHDGYRVGDVANGYVLTEQGWLRLHDDGATATAYEPGPARRSRTGLWVTLVVAAIVVVGVVGGVVLSIAYARRPAATSAPEVTSAATPSSSTTTAEPTPSESTTTTPPAPASEGKLFSYSGTASLSLRGVKSAEITIAKPVEFRPTNPGDTSARGRLVYVPVLVRVVGKEKASIDPYDFEVVLPDGEHLDVAYVKELPKESPAQLRAEDVDPGKTVVASIPFDVPAGVPLKVAYTYSGQVLGTWR